MVIPDKDGNTLFTRIDEQELRDEIEKSKRSFCSNVEDSLHHIFDEMALSTRQMTKENCIQRIINFGHIPPKYQRYIKKKDIMGTNDLPFMPYSHWRLENNKPVELVRSHWTGSIENGEFAQRSGRLTERLGKLIIYFAHDFVFGVSSWGKHSWSEFYLDACQQWLCQYGLRWDPGKGDVKAFFNQFCQYACTEVYNQEYPHGHAKMTAKRPELILDHRDPLEEEELAMTSSKETIKELKEK